MSPCALKTFEAKKVAVKKLHAYFHTQMLGPTKFSHPVEGKKMISMPSGPIPSPVDIRKKVHTDAL